MVSKIIIGCKQVRSHSWSESFYLIVLLHLIHSLGVFCNIWKEEGNTPIFVTRFTLSPLMCISPSVALGCPKTSLVINGYFLTFLPPISLEVHTHTHTHTHRGCAHIWKKERERATERQSERERDCHKLQNPLPNANDILYLSDPFLYHETNRYF